ncbi:hypothetical protein PHJA_000710200 [Phtheirospermum japonicum]|uniref:Transmembrane protein n=1 Tax=Phtheirospermum japonicum TaxID=374723 RepID=A0A830BPA4_9LAMI|nr:hypothetical protein PHJA_000710200 [Phtheirospermum japonicum]
MPPPTSGGDSSGCKRLAVERSIQKTLSKTSLLTNYILIETLLTFEMVLPNIYTTGECSPITTNMIYLFLGLSTLSCFFFHFTDSFWMPDGKFFYGFMMPKGLEVFKMGLNVEVSEDEKYTVGLSDFVHVLMYVLVFMAMALSDHCVTGCVFPCHTME